MQTNFHGLNTENALVWEGDLSEEVSRHPGEGMKTQRKYFKFLCLIFKNSVTFHSSLFAVLGKLPRALYILAA